MKTDKVSGYFDVRKFDKKVERKDRKISPEGDQIALIVTFPLNELPDIFKADGAVDEFVKSYVSRTEQKKAEEEKREAVNDRASVKFKIGTGTKWFDKYGKAVEKPSNEELDGKQYEVKVEFRRRAKNPEDALAPSGYWANAIMYREIEQNPFADDAFEDEPEQAPASAPKTSNEVENPDLPF